MAISLSDINALYSQALGRNATKSELSYWSSKSLKSSLINALAKTPGISETFKQTYPNATNATGTTGTAPATPAVATPEQSLLDQAKTLTPEKQAEFDKRAYHQFVLDYGVEDPGLTAKFGLPTGYDRSKTQLGQAQAAYGAQGVFNAQNYGSALEDYELGRRQITKEWQALRAAIDNGTVDPSSETAAAYMQNLQDKTRSLSDTRNSLSSRGTLYGGVARKQLALAAQPYDRQSQNIERSTQNSYQAAMDQYLGNKKGAQLQYGVDNPATSGQDFGYGGGLWDAASGTFSNLQYGITPQQAQEQNLSFFGADPYSQLLKQQQIEQSLKTQQAQASAAYSNDLAYKYTSPSLNY